LEPLTGQVSKGLVLVLGTSLADIYQQFNDRVNSRIGHASRSPEGIALYQATDDLRPLLYAQSVHCSLLMIIKLERLSIVKKKIAFVRNFLYRQ
jgi:hypothetical protein